MRIAYGLLLGTLLAAPAMADELVIKTPNPGAADRDMRHDLNAARREDQKADRMEQKADRLEQKADRNLGEANRDRNQARGDDTLKLKVEPR